MGWETKRRENHQLVCRRLSRFPRDGSRAESSVAVRQFVVVICTGEHCFKKKKRNERKKNLTFLCQRLWEKLEPYHPLDLSSAAGGLFLAFFGGRYLLLLAAIEAARQVGFDKFKKNIIIIYESWRTVYEQNLIDNAKDDDKNGKADVEELSRKDLFSRKFKLLLRTTDPDILYSALSALWVQFLGICVTLRVQFAQTVTLGVAIGETIEQPLQKYLAPVVSAGVYPEYRQWIPFSIKQFSRFVGVSIAFSVQRVISGFYAAIRGGQLFSVGLLSYLVHHKYMVSTEETNRGFKYTVSFYAKGNHVNGLLIIVHQAIMGAVFVLGFWFQLSTFFGLPFPLNILMFPFTIAENILLYFVGSDVQTGQAGARS